MPRSAPPPSSNCWLAVSPTPSRSSPTPATPPPPTPLRGYVANVYRFEAGKGYVSAPEGGATAKGDESNFVFAESWSKNIWAEVLS